MQNPIGTNLAYYLPDAAPWLKALLAQFDAIKFVDACRCGAGGCDSGEEVVGPGGGGGNRLVAAVVLIAVAATGGVQLDKGLTPIYTDATDSRARA